MVVPWLLLSPQYRGVWVRALAQTADSLLFPQNEVICWEPGYDIKLGDSKSSAEGNKYYCRML